MTSGHQNWHGQLTLFHVSLKISCA